MELLMAVAFHQIIDHVISVIPSFGRQMQIDHGGCNQTVAHVLLYDPEIYICFQQVCGIAVPQRVNADSLFIDVSQFDCSAQRALDCAF